MQVTPCSNHSRSTGHESRPHRVQQAVLSCLAKTTEAQIFLLGRQCGLEEKKRGWIQDSLLLNNCVILGKSLSLLELQFSPV